MFRWPWIRKKASAVTQQIVMMLSGQPAYPPTDSKNLSEEGYQKCITAYACITLIAESLSSIPWRLVSISGGKETEVTGEHELLKLWDRPNPELSGQTFRSHLIQYMLITGDSYLEFAGADSSRGRSDNGRIVPRELWLLRPDRMKVIGGNAEGERIGGYEHTVEGKPQNFKPDEVHHFRFFHPTNDWYGLSPLAVAAVAVNTEVGATFHNYTLLENRGRPDGILVAPEGATIGPDQKTEIAEQIQERLSGSKVGKPLVMSGGFTWTPMSFSPVELDYLDSRASTKKDVAQAFRVPPEVIGDAANKTYSNYREAREALWTDAIIPLVNYLAAEVNYGLVPRFGTGLRLKPDLDGLDALSPSRERLWERVSGAPHLTINEKRLMTGLEEVPGGDVILVSSTLRPLGEEEDLLEPGDDDLDNDDTPPDDGDK